MNTKPIPSPSGDDDGVPDVNHDESRRDLRDESSGPGGTDDPDDVSRDQNHDESRINAFDPEVARKLKNKPHA